MEHTPVIAIRLFNEMQLFVDGRLARLPQRKATRQVWAFLLMNVNQPVRRDQVHGRIWPELPEASGKKALREALSFLRTFLQECGLSAARLSADRDYLKWTELDGDTLDVAQFERSADAALDPLAGLKNTTADQIAGRDAIPTRLALLLSASDAYGGALLLHWPDEWLCDHRDRLIQRYQRVTERLIAEAFDVGEYGLVVSKAGHYLKHNPLREQTVGRLMAARYATGDASGAALEFEAFASALEQELSAEPSSETQAIMAAIRSSAPSDDVVQLASRFTTLLAELELDLDLAEANSPALHGAPNIGTNFVGRLHEQSELIDLARQFRLVTLVGPGGIGKTRLAAEVALVLAKDLLGGAYWVDLTMISEASQLPGVILAVLGISQQTGSRPIDLITAHLAYMPAMLVLDNCEHVLADAVELSQAVLAQCPEVHILATSREALRLPDERTFPVPSLDLPPEGQVVDAATARAYSAVQLFMDRAEQARPGYGSEFGTTRQSEDHVENPSRRTSLKQDALDFIESEGSLPSELRAILTICRGLEGIPLAIELAAALMSYMSAPEIAVRLDQAIGLLVRGSRTTPRRHQTLRAVVDWSCQLLADEERQLFRRLSVFVGPFEIDAVREVCSGVEAEFRPAESTPTIANWIPADDKPSDGAVKRLVDRLIATSLVIRLETYGDSEREQYRLLEPIRQFAAELAQSEGEAGQLAFRHAAYYLRLADEALPHLKVNPEISWLQRLDDALVNIRAAMAWMAQHEQAEAGMQLAGALWRYWYVRSHVEYERSWVNAILGLEPPHVNALYVADALECAGVLAFAQSEQREAAAMYRRCCDILEAHGETARLAENLDRLALAESPSGEHELALEHAFRALKLKRSTGNEIGEATSLSIVADVYSHLANWEAAQEYYELSVETFESIGNQPHARLRALRGLALVEGNRGNFDVATRLVAHGLSFARMFGDRLYETSMLHQLGVLAQKQDRNDEAYFYYCEALRLARKANARAHEVLPLNNLGHLAWLAGRPDDAEALFIRALSRLGANSVVLNRLVPTINLAATRSVLGDSGRSADYATVANELASQLRVRMLTYVRLSIVPTRSSWPSGPVAEWRRQLLD